MRLARSYHDYYIDLCRLRPPCPLCPRRTLPTRGLDDEEIFLCLRHGHWIPATVYDRHGDPLPLFRWERYLWHL